MITLALNDELLAETPEFEELYPELKIHGYGIGTPEPNLNYVEVPGRNGVLDLTSVMGPVTFKNRSVYFGAIEYADAPAHISRYSEILNKYHGKQVKIVFADDKEYYYTGRCLVSAEYENNMVRGIEFEIDANPLKYPVYASDEDWLWDPFNFETGVIRNYSNIVVSTYKEVEVIAYEQEESPKFYVQLAQGQTSMRMVFDGETYYMSNGLNEFPQIVIQSLDIYEDIFRFTFYGQGTVSINLSGGIL